MVGYMIMPNALEAYKTTLTGERLFNFVNGYVEGKSAGFAPFNDGSLPISSGMTLEIKYDSSYKLTNIYVNGEPINFEQEYSFIILSVAGFI